MGSKEVESVVEQNQTDDMLRPRQAFDGMIITMGDSRETFYDAQLAERNEPKLSPKELVEVLSEYPDAKDLWPLFMPRVYKEVDKYCSVKLPAATMISAVIAARQGMLKHSRPMKATFGAADHIRRFDTQMIFVSPDLLKAAMLSSPPEGMKWMDLHLPYDAAILMLPKGVVKDANGKSYDFVCYSRRRKGDHVSGELANLPELSGEMQHDSFTSFTLATDGDGCILESAWTPEMSPYITDLDIDPIVPATPVELALSEAEQDIIRLLSTIVFRLSLILESRPTLMTSGRRVGNYKKRTGVEIWTPNILGLHYKIKTEGFDGVKGTHASPRMHWRRGHSRRQVYGPGRKDRKIIWLEPCLVAGGKEEDD